jgi:hypothetical protein
MAVRLHPLAIHSTGEDDEDLRETLDGLVERGDLEVVVEAEGRVEMGREAEGKRVGYVASRELMRAVAETASRN